MRDDDPQHHQGQSELRPGPRLERRREHQHAEGRDGERAPRGFRGQRHERQAAERDAERLGVITSIDPNVAEKAELMQLPGVGEATADRILAAREAGQTFQRADDLRRVRGIGPAKMEANITGNILALIARFLSGASVR